MNVGRLRVASVYPSGVDFVHSDHLGSPRKVTDASGNVKAFSDFYPFGLPAATNGIQGRWYAGYELEHQNTGSTYTDDLYFLHARWYFPSVSRFTSPEPVRGTPQAPQSFNLYAYVRNNPINGVDPDGLVVKLLFMLPGDRVRFMHQLRWITGLNLGVEADGTLVIRGLLKDGAGKLMGSETARNMLRQAIESARLFQVVGVNGERSVSLAQAVPVRRRGLGQSSGRIFIDFDDFQSLDPGGNRRITFESGMAFFHELAHFQLGAEDPPAGQPGTGPVVERVNQIRRELGLPVRLQYHEVNGAFIFEEGPITWRFSETVTVTP